MEETNQKLEELNQMSHNNFTTTKNEVSKLFIYKYGIISSYRLFPYSLYKLFLQKTCEGLIKITC